MNLLLTDRLTCPRCGPAFGLILLANVMEDRRVRDGVLGCSNCRDSFPVREGFVDLRPPPRGSFGPGRAGSPVTEGGEADGRPDDQAARVVALLGIQRGPGTVALAGRPARWAGIVAASVQDLDVVAVDADTASWSERDRVSRMITGPALPFFDRVLRGVVVDGALGRATIFEAARVIAPLSRVVVVHADAEAARVLAEAGLEILAQEGETVVGARG